MPRLVALAALLALAPLARAATIEVDSGTDDGTGCTLREAVTAAFLDAPAGGCTPGDGADVITFSVPSVTLAQGEIVLRGELTIAGPVVIEGTGTDRVFRIAGGTTTLDGLTVRGGVGDGGGLRIGGAATVTIVGGAFERNRAPFTGGAIAIEGGVALEVDGTAFTGNVARGPGGGALHAIGGTATVTGATFTDNRALDGASGGAILWEGIGTLDVGSSTFRANRAQGDGGALVATNGTVGLEAVDLEGNVAVGRGGAVYATGGAALGLDGGTVLDNRAGGGGGGLWTGPDVVLSVEGTRFERNATTGARANRGGGALAVLGGTATISGAAFEDNRATGDRSAGGALLVRGGAVTLEGGTSFTRNRAPYFGGAVYVSAGGADGPASLTATDVAFRRNVALSPSQGRGGALYAVGDPEGDRASVTVDGGTFQNNASEGSSGAIHAEAGSVLSLEGAAFTRNRAREYTGAVYVNETPTTIRDVLFEANVCPEAPDKGYGGALTARASTVTVERTTFRRNAGWSGGGALAVYEDVLLTISDGTLFEGNRARADDGRGGAIVLLDEFSVLQIDDATFVGNKASDGGAMWITADTIVDVARTTFRGNAALRRGGAVYQDGYFVGAGASVTIAESLVHANAAGVAGGALFLDLGGSTSIENTTLTANEAPEGGAIASLEAELELTSATVAGNSSGLYNDDNGSFTYVRLRNTIVADHAGDDLDGLFASLGHNVIGSTPSAATFPPEPTDQLGTDPRLEALADNGGPTLTMALEGGSPAIGAAVPTVAVDQRGYLRDEAPDVGAFEFGASPPGLEAPAAGLEAAPTGLEVAPNPVAGRATVRFGLEARGPVRVSLYDVTGRRVRTLFDGEAEGVVEAGLDATGLAAGVYVVVLEGAGVRSSRRVSVVR